MSKVKMDVMRPWIANRVTELIGFEDEVLINFIYGLLDGKEINGKEVQISLTGFMERNTGKFMKELWSLLLSAQKNASGVPQQFLNDKEEETKKKKAESDQIANEIQRRKKESPELELERNEKMDRGCILKDVDSVVEPSSKHEQRPSVARSVEEKKPKDKNGARGRSRVSKSPHSINLSSSSRGTRSRSISKSVSNSRSYSGDRPRSLSASNKRRGRSGSSERIHRYSTQRFLTHRRGSPCCSYSPSRRSSYSKRRSSSRSHRRSPSPTRYRMRRRSRSPIRHRSRSPIWRRPRSPTRRSSPWNGSLSPIRRQSSSLQKRSPSPIQRKSPSPLRCRSPSPLRQKYRGSMSPIRHRSRSPMRRRSRSPMQRRSRSPIRRRSRSPIRRRSRSPIRRSLWSPFRGRSRSPIWRRSSSPIHHKSPSPEWHESVPPSGSSSPRRSSRLVNHKSPSSRDWSSASPVQRRSPSPVGRRSPKRHRRSPLQSPRGRIRELEKHTPVHDTVARNAVECLTDTRQRSNSLDHQSDSWDRNDSHIKLKRSLPSPRWSPPVSEAERETSLIEKRSVKIRHIHSPNPSRKAREKRLHNGTSETYADDKEKFVGESSKMRYNSLAKISSPDQHKSSRIVDSEDVAPERFSVHHPVQAETRGRTELNKNNPVLQRGNKSEKLEHQTKPGQQDSHKIRDIRPSEKKNESPIKVGERAGEKNQSHFDDTKMRDRHLEDLSKLSRKVMRNDQSFGF